MNIISVVRNYRDSTRLPIYDERIRGACYRSAMELTRILRSHGHDAVVMEKTAGGHHAVAAVELCGRLVKIDFTGRQFSSMCNVPLVGDSVDQNSISEFWRSEGKGFHVASEELQPQIRSSEEAESYALDRAYVMQGRIARRHGRHIPKHILATVMG